MSIQLPNLFAKLDHLQQVYGDPGLHSIYGAGCIHDPKLCLVFMNPTAKNISSNPNWQGIRAPWLGTKNIWKLYAELDLISPKTFSGLQNLKAADWTPKFCLELYSEIAKNKIYVTNLAKCTMSNARSLSNKVFREYLDLMRDEINLIKPQKTITFGNQVSSIILGKNISVSTYIPINHIYPVHYPVGQGMRNMNLAIESINRIISHTL